MAEIKSTSGQGADLLNLTARYKVEIDGGSLDQQAPYGMEALSVEDHIDMVGVAEITFSGAGSPTAPAGSPSEPGATMDGSSVKVGATIKVRAGKGGVMSGAAPSGGSGGSGGSAFSTGKTATSGSREYAFVGIVTGMRQSYIKSKDSMTVLAMDPLCKLAASRRTKVYEEMKDSDIVQQVLGEAGVEIGNIEATQETRKYVLQRNESDFMFCRRLAARNGYLLQSNDGKIDFAKAQYSSAPIEFKKADIISLDYSFSDRSIPKKVTVYGWDYVKKEKVEGSASAGDIDTIGGGDNSVEKTGQVYQGESYITDVFVDSQEAAKELAKSHLNNLARNFLRGRAIIQGNAGITAGQKVKFLGASSSFQPEGYVLSARLRVFQGSGETTEIIFCSNTHPNG